MVFPHRSHVPGAFCNLRNLHRQYFVLTWAKTSRDFSTTSILNATLRRVTKTIWKMFFHSLFSFSPSRLCPKFQHIETFFSLIRGTYKVKGWKGNLGAVPWAPHTIYSLVDEAFSIPPNFQGKQTQTRTRQPGTSPLFNIEILGILCCYYNCCCCLWREKAFPKVRGRGFREKLPWDGRKSKRQEGHAGGKGSGQQSGQKGNREKIPLKSKAALSSLRAFKKSRAGVKNALCKP